MMQEVINAQCVTIAKFLNHEKFSSTIIFSLYCLSSSYFTLWCLGAIRTTVRLPTSVIASIEGKMRGSHCDCSEICNGDWGLYQLEWWII